MDDYTLKDVNRFWSKVDLSKADEEFACWEWVAARDANGYGMIWWRVSKQLAHRIGYLLAFELLPDDLFLCHHCDNPSCVNPNHLFLGTVTDNTHDMMQKGRNAQPHGEQNGNHKLSDAQVIEIRHRYAQGGVTYKELARDYRVGKSQIGNIVNRISR